MPRRETIGGKRSDAGKSAALVAEALGIGVHTVYDSSMQGNNLMKFYSVCKACHVTNKNIRKVFHGSELPLVYKYKHSSGLKYVLP